MEGRPGPLDEVRQRIFSQPQFQTRARLRQQKLRVTFIGYIIVLVFLAMVQFVGVGFFTLGFLLRRDVLPNVAEGTTDAAYLKAVVLVIDALRFDFAVPVPELAHPYHNLLPVLHELAAGDHGVLLKFVADPPTTTLQRLKGLTTGLLPTFIDAGLNFDGDAIDEDNWMLQLHRHNRSVAFVGDDTWDALFNAYIAPDMNYPYESLNVWDLHTVDNGVIEHLFPLLDQQHRWDVLIGHFLGVDHVGHRYGPDHFTMREKLGQMDRVIRDVVAKLDDDTLLVVMGDHGMDLTGNHGGDSPDEVEAALLLYSKGGHFHKQPAAAYDAGNQGARWPRVNQIDLVPTLLVLLGLPVPFNNLGFPIAEAFALPAALEEAARLTAAQLAHVHQLQGLEVAAMGPGEFSTARARAYQQRLLEECRHKWAEFDLTTIGIGLAILFFALTFILTYARLIPLVRVLTMLFEFIGSVIAMSLLGLVLAFSVFVVLKPASVEKCLGVGASLGTLIGFWAPIMDRFSVLWLLHSVKDFFVYNFNMWLFMGLLFVLLHTLVFALNLFVVWEDQMINFFVVTFGFCLVFACATTNKLTAPTRILGLSHALTFTVLSRLVATIGICREEQRPYCQPTFALLWWLLVLLYGVAWLLPLVVMHFYRLLDLYHLAAPLWVGTGLKCGLFVCAAYWLLEYAQSHPQLAWMQLLVVKLVKLAMARLLLFAALFLANLSWSKGPLCVKLAGDGDRQTILGYNNVYGSLYMLLVLNFFVAVMLVLKPLAAVLLAMLVVQVLLLLELFDMLDIRRNLVAPILFTLLGYQHFFSTGHQATIPLVQWEVGFITTETIWFPFTHLNIVLNTFGLFIVVALAVPLITLWKIPPTNKPITVLSQIITNVTTMLTYQLVILLLLLVFAAHFRRHLMVWKIFAPRFMLSGMLLIVMNLTLVLVTLWFGTGKVVTQVNRIFGK